MAFLDLKAELILLYCVSDGVNGGSGLSFVSVSAAVLSPGRN